MFLQVVFSADEASSSVKEVPIHPWKHQWTIFYYKSTLEVMIVYMTLSLSVVLSQCIEGVIGGTDYNQNKVNQWTASIVEHALTHLVKQGRPFKYIGELIVHNILKHDTSGRTVDMWSICVTLLSDVSQWTVPSCRRAAQVSTQLTPATGTLPLMVRDILLKLLY